MFLKCHLIELKRMIFIILFQIIAKHLYLDMELGKSISSYRLHNQGVPNKNTYNTAYPPGTTLIQRLRDIGHKVGPSGWDCVVQAVAKKQNMILAKSDPRKFAEADGF